MANTQAKVLIGNLFGHVATMSVTASLELMAVFLVDLIDRVFMSMSSEAELPATAW